MVNRQQQSKQEKRKPKVNQPKPNHLSHRPRHSRVPRVPARLKALAEGRTIKPLTRLVMHHKFIVGQLVDYNPGRVGMPASSWQYKIVPLLPAERSDLLYRIKSLGETFERVARERELAAR